MIWTLIVAVIIIFGQFVWNYRKVDNLRKEYNRLEDKYNLLVKTHNNLLRKMSDKIVVPTKFAFKNGDDIGKRSVKIKNTSDGVKYYARAKRGGKFADVEVFPK